MNYIFNTYTFTYIFDFIFDRHIVYLIFSNCQCANCTNTYLLTMIIKCKDGLCLYWASVMRSLGNELWKTETAIFTLHFTT